VWGVVDGRGPSTTPHFPIFLRRYCAWVAHGEWANDGIELAVLTVNPGIYHRNSQRTLIFNLLKPVLKPGQEYSYDRKSIKET
jgi:hypothetical protein